MGRLIDEYEDIKTQQECVSKTIDTLWKMAQKYQQLRAEYEKRLKADMVATLEELKKEVFVELAHADADGIIVVDMDDFNNFIQQKINELKADKE